MSSATVCARIDVREIPQGERHTRIFAAFRALGGGDALAIVADHRPKPLTASSSSKHPGNFSWAYVLSGPETWCVSIGKLARAHGAGECCGGA